MTDDYPYWFVTKGKDKTSVGRHGLKPIALAPKNVTTLRQLAGIARATIDARATTLLPANASAIERLKVLSGKYASDAYADLWVSEVRTSAFDDSDASEEATRWVFLSSGELLPMWQGYAKGVVNEHEPFTIRQLNTPPAPFKILDD